MKTPPQLVHDAHGAPPVDGCAPGSGLCYVCVGVITRGKLIKDWLSSNFTDANRARCPTATHVCEACCYVMSRTSPVLGRPPKDGKKFGGNFRNYSHLFDERGYVNASKGEKPAIRGFLQRPHSGVWFAAIADSGQKHVLTFAPLNYGHSGVVLFEEQLVELPESFALVDDCTDMLSGGITKDELLTGQYRQTSWREMTTEIREFEREHSHERGGPWLTLAVWLAQRDNEAHAAVADERKERDKNAKANRPKPARNKGSGVRPNRPKRLPSEVQRAPANELLDPIRGTPEERRNVDVSPERMGQLVRPQAPVVGAVQGRFPGFD